MSLPPIGSGALNPQSVLALRAQILQRNAAMTARATPVPAASSTSFDSAITDALRGINTAQSQAGTVAESYERGDSIDIAAVMIARQKAAISFEATLQVRNKLLSAYKDIMSMPV